MRRLIITTTVVSFLVLLAASPALAAAPWWHLTPSSLPSYLPANGQGTVIVNATNLGDADAEGAGADGPIVFTDTLPPGLKALRISAAAGFLGNLGPGFPFGLAIECSRVTSVPLTCTSVADLPPYDQIVVKIAVEVLPGASLGAMEVNAASISGGGAPAVTVSRPLTVSDEPTPFGLSSYELDVEGPDGAPDVQAGSHPFQVTSTVMLNKALLQGSNGKGALEAPIALPKNFGAKLPAGMIGNPTPLPRCSLVKFLDDIEHDHNACPVSTVIGVASVLVDEPGSLGVTGFTQPLYNLEPAFGEPARFGFFVPVSETTVLLDTSVRSGPGEDYGITVTSPNTEQIAALLSSQITFWGVPGEAIHDKSRGWGCVKLPVAGPCDESGPEQEHPPGFLIQPTSCSGEPLQSSIAVDSWVQPADFLNVPVSAGLPTQHGCNRLAFSPTMKTEPTSDSAASPSGLDFNLYFQDEGLTSAEGNAQSQLKNTVVVLPEGFTINPSAGVGLAGCTEADYARETVNSAPGAGCPNESKLGTVEIETPLLTQKIDGNIFIATPYQNPPGSLVALYVVAKNPETGILIKLVGKVTPNLVTGRLTTTFENNPQLPFDHFNFHFREGQQAPLVTPPTCGTYSTQAQLTPWSEPTTTLTDTSSFEITSGVGGGACPVGNTPPFKPGIASGTVNNNAGAYSPFYLHLTRGDADQEISGFTTNLPPGLTGELTGLPFCPNADIEAARHKTGREEEASPSCPAASEVGHTLVGTGVGAVLAYVPGKIYFAGPFDGAPFSLVSVTSAVVGPFDLGTVVLRFGLAINPYTAQVNVSPTSSEPIPTIIKGIVTHVRDIRVYINRPNFIIDPTNCSPMAIGSTLTSSLGAGATITSPFQAASCGNLAFYPKFAVSTSAKTSRADGASLHVHLTYPSGAQGTYANIAKVKVELPKQLPSRLTTLQKACTNAQFEANPAGCPTPSVIGQAKAVVPNIPEPLSGPVYFVSHGGEAFPSLEIVLQGYGVKVVLVGATYISKSGVTSTTFKAIPDNPVTSFELTLPEGKYSALAANGNLCALTTTKTVSKKVTVRVKGHNKTVTRKVKQTTPASLQMPTEFIGQNGAELHQNTPVTVTGCPKAKKAKKHKKGQARGKGKAKGRK